MAGKSKASGDLSPGTAIGNEGSGGGPATKARAPEQKATGQSVSLERGKATRSKKQPGKRPTQGGN